MSINVTKTSTNLWSDIITLPSEIETFDDNSNDDLSILDAAIIDESNTNKVYYFRKGCIPSFNAFDENKTLLSQLNIRSKYETLATSLHHITYEASNKCKPRLTLHKRDFKNFGFFSKTEDDDIKKEFELLYTQIRSHFHSILLHSINKVENDSSIFLKKIDSLLEDNEDDYDEKFLPPSEQAIIQMKDFIKYLCIEFENKLPFPSFSPDGKGGLEASWHINNRYLQLIIPSGEKKPYIFQKEGSKFSIEPFSDVYELIRWVNWLLQTNTSKVAE